MPRLRIALCVLALSSGCTSVRSLDVGGGSREAEGLPVLAIDEGILVLDIGTEVPIAALEMGLVTAVSDLPAGEHLLFLAVSEGKHRWTEVVVQRPRGEIRYGVPRSDAYAFRVERGRISYSGAISIRAEERSSRLSFSIRSRSAEVLAALRKSHPALVERFPPTDAAGARYRKPDSPTSRRPPAPGAWLQIGAKRM